VYSEETQRVIDTEVSRLLREAEDHAVQLLRTHRGALDLLTRELLDEETVSGDVVHAIAEQSRAVGVGTPRP
jgi:cell division protease FtsH